MDKQSKIEQCKARIKAAELRIRACSQRNYALAYQRQSEHPAYPGQEIVCTSKRDQTMAFADKTDAQADLILAEAGLLL